MRITIQRWSLWYDRLFMGFYKILVPEHSVFTPQIVLVVSRNCFTEFFNPMHWWFVAYNFNFPFYLSFRSIQALSQFLLYIFLLSHFNNLNSRVQHPVARVSIGFTNVYYHRTQLNSLSLSLFTLSPLHVLAYLEAIFIYCYYYLRNHTWRWPLYKPKHVVKLK
jgi:hypothetical protein